MRNVLGVSFLLRFSVFLVPPVGQPWKRADAAAWEMWPKDRDQNRGRARRGMEELVAKWDPSGATMLA